jgi:hypothetical protein
MPSIRTRPLRFWPCLAIALSISGAVPLATATGEEPVGKDHVLFLGLNVGMDEGRFVCPVVAADSQSVEILKNGRRERVPLRFAHFVTLPELKVSRARIDIRDVKVERRYTLASDPAMSAIAQQMTMASVQEAAQERAAAELQQAEATVAGIQRAVASGLPVSPSDQSSASKGLVDAVEAYNTSYTNLPDGLDPGAAAAGVGGSDAYDVFEVSFRLEAPDHVVEDAFAALRMMVRDPANPGVPMTSVKFFPLPRLGEKTRRVSLMQAGLPPGFAVDSYAVHVYTGDGRELATNLSSKRMDLTEEQAWQYLLFQHVTKHKDVDEAVRIAGEMLPPELGKLIPKDRLLVPVDVAVDRHGKIKSVTVGPGKTLAEDAGLVEALKRVRIFPAIEDGEPVDSRGTFLLSDFVP